MLEGLGPCNLNGGIVLVKLLCWTTFDLRSGGPEATVCDTTKLGPAEIANFQHKFTHL